MARAHNGDVSLFYERTGSGDPVLYVSEAGLGGWSWGWQHAVLAGPFESIVWDFRGTGRSDCPPGPYDRESLVGDLVAVLRACERRRTHVVGCGFGGVIALEAARRTNRVATLTLVGTACTEASVHLEPLYGSPTDSEALQESLAYGFSTTFLNTHPDVCSGIIDWRADGDATEDGWKAQLSALESFDATPWLTDISLPTLVCHGTADRIVPVSAGRELADRLPRGDFVEFENAGHLVTIERSKPFNDQLFGFLEDHPID